VTAWPPDAPSARIVDLTHPLVGHAPTHPGQPASLLQTVATVADGGSPTEPCHHALLGAGVLITENLNGLDELSADRCWFSAAPLLTGGGDGGFRRAFAAVPP
jgi:kynurenine formamidase